MTLLDVAMAHAARSRASHDGVPEPTGVVTIEMKTSFMRPAHGRLRRHRPAAAPHRVDGLLRSHGGRRRPASSCAHATGTFKYLSGAAAPAASASSRRDASD